LTFKTATKGKFLKNCLLLFEGTLTPFFKDKKSKRSHKTVGIKVFLTILLDDRRIRIQEAQKHTDPTDLDPDSDPQHSFLESVRKDWSKRIFCSLLIKVQYLIVGCVDHLSELHVLAGLLMLLPPLLTHYFHQRKCIYIENNPNI
jgi:hypothetical protein